MPRTGGAIIAELGSVWALVLFVPGKSMQPTDRLAIAARLPSLCEGVRGTVAMTAIRLGVEKLALRASIDESSPHPTFEVLLGAIRYFGVDPAWLITGQYSRESHVEAVVADEDAQAEHIRRLLAELSIQPLRWTLPSSNGRKSSSSSR